MSTDEPEEAEWGLVMPFVVCASQGGPYDDASFVAGTRLGEVMVRLHDHRCFFPGNEFAPDFPVEPALVPQMDLLAMHEGCTLTTEPWGYGAEWVYVTFTPAPSDPPE